MTLSPSSQGYALLEYSTQKEAMAAIGGANNTKLLDQTISVDFAFVRPPPTTTTKGQAGRAGRAGAAKGGRTRSRSPKAEGEREGEKDEGKDE